MHALMKMRWLPAGAVLLVASCTAVDDFGEYWNKGVVDPALEGRWKKIGIPGEALDDTPGADTLIFVKRGASYSVQLVNPLDPALTKEAAAEQMKDNETRLAVRTLAIARHRFFMVRPLEGHWDGLIERYEVRGGILREFILDNGAALDWLAAKHPAPRNITEDIGEGGFVVIHTFDAEVFRALSEMADDAYWILRCQYKKIS